MRRGVGGTNIWFVSRSFRSGGTRSLGSDASDRAGGSVERMTDLCVARHDFGQPVVGHAVRYARFRRPEHEDTVDVGTSDAICRPHCLFIDVIQTLSLRACY